MPADAPRPRIASLSFPGGSRLVSPLAEARPQPAPQVVKRTGNARPRQRAPWDDRTTAVARMPEPPAPRKSVRPLPSPDDSSPLAFELEPVDWDDDEEEEITQATDSLRKDDSGPRPKLDAAQVERLLATCDDGPPTRPDPPKPAREPISSRPPPAAAPRPAASQPSADARARSHVTAHGYAVLPALGSATPAARERSVEALDRFAPRVDEAIRAPMRLEPPPVVSPIRSAETAIIGTPVPHETGPFTAQPAPHPALLQPAPLHPRPAPRLVATPPARSAPAPRATTTAPTRATAAASGPHATAASAEPIASAPASGPHRTASSSGPHTVAPHTVAPHAVAPHAVAPHAVASAAPAPAAAPASGPHAAVPPSGPHAAVPSSGPYPIAAPSDQLDPSIPPPTVGWDDLDPRVRDEVRAAVTHLAGPPRYASSSSSSALVIVAMVGSLLGGVVGSGLTLLLVAGDQPGIDGRARSHEPSAPESAAPGSDSLTLAAAPSVEPTPAPTDAREPTTDRTDPPAQANDGRTGAAEPRAIAAAGPRAIAAAAGPSAIAGADQPDTSLSRPSSARLTPRQLAMRRRMGELRRQRAAGLARASSRAQEVSSAAAASEPASAPAPAPAATPAPAPAPAAPDSP